MKNVWVLMMTKASNKESFVCSWWHSKNPDCLHITQKLILFSGRNVSSLTQVNLSHIIIIKFLQTFTEYSRSWSFKEGLPWKTRRFDSHFLKGSPEIKYGSKSSAARNIQHRKHWSTRRTHASLVSNWQEVRHWNWMSPASRSMAAQWILTRRQALH